MREVFCLESFFTLFDKYGLPALMLAALMWYIWQKDKLHRQETETLRKAIDRLTASVEKLLTYVREKE